MQRPSMRLLGLLSAIVLAVPAFAFARPNYLCRMTGQRSPSCCCPSERAVTRGRAEVERESCCQLIEAEPTTAPNGSTESIRFVESAAVVAVVDRFLDHVADSAHPREPARTTHPPGPPRFLMKCSFLI